MNVPVTVDCRIDADWIVPVEPVGEILYRHALVLNGSRILDVLPQQAADSRYVAHSTVRLPGHALIPGLVNLHTHAAMTLLRGYADDLPLMTWLHDHIWPAEARWVSPDYVRDGSRLACLEMLKGGITCFNDMYFFPGEAVTAAIEAHQRITSGIIVIDFPTAYAADPAGYLQKGLAVRDAWKGHPLANFCLAPHAPYSTSDQTLGKVLTYADQLDLPIHIHVHETRDEIRQGLESHGLRPLARLHNLGLLGPNFIGVHAVHLTAEELNLLASCGSHLVHCPSSNLKLASGIAPVTDCLAQDINVALGTDSAASNNRLDIFGEMRLAALLAKGVTGRADAVSAQQALAMATLNGARALGLDGEIGSLTVGKQADVVAVDLSAVGNQPCFDPVSQLVYSAERHDVTHVWIAGKAVVESRHCLTIDEAEVLHKARHWGERIAAK